MGPTGKGGHMEDVVEKVVTDDHLDEYHDAGGHSSVGKPLTQCAQVLHAKSATTMTR